MLPKHFPSRLFLALFFQASGVTYAAVPRTSGYFCADMRAYVAPFLEGSFDHTQGGWSRPVQAGEQLTTLLQRNLPADFKTEFATDIARVFTGLRRVTGQRVIPDLGEVVASFDVENGDIAVSLEEIRRDNMHPIWIYLHARHELRHVLTSENAQHHEGLRLRTRDGMTREEFVAENLDAALKDEAISWYEEYLMIRRLLESPNFSALARRILPSYTHMRSLIVQITRERPAPGRETLAFIQNWLATQTDYPTTSVEYLEQIYRLAGIGGRSISAVNGWSIAEVIAARTRL